MNKITIEDLAKAYGYQLVIDDSPNTHPDSLGDPGPDSPAAVLSGDRIAVWSLSSDWVYSITHEMAEDYCGFQGHTDLLWMTHTNLLAAWAINAFDNSLTPPGWWLKR